MIIMQRWFLHTAIFCVLKITNKLPQLYQQVLAQYFLYIEGLKSYIDQLAYLISRMTLSNIWSQGAYHPQ